MRTRGAVMAVLAVWLTVDAGAQATGNRLRAQKSPYLQLHANDPIAWYPWGPEAFAAAKKAGKPIFLSIGYSTCHWCHVMRTESFTDASIAAVLNEHFIAIKVDREERPDVDRIYMTYVQSVSGGGWPLTVFLTPDREPFFGATYVPRDDREREPGLRTLLLGISGFWAQDRPKALEAAAESMRLIRDRASGLRPSTLADRSALQSAYEMFRASYDVAHGGFGGAPKFPRPVALNFLLRYHARTGERPALDMVVRTLKAMVQGGVRDHLGGGFHRYATDAEWRVPHFEKMLYDQALIASALIDAYQASGDPELGAAARETLDFVLRELRSGEGGFLSALDADSPEPAAGGQRSGRSREGAYYVWSWDDVQRVLGPALMPVFAMRYGVVREGNVPRGYDPQGELAGQNVLRVAVPVQQVAKDLGRPVSTIQRQLEDARRLMQAAGRTRMRPAKDDKVLVSWNGLMISALARGAQVFDRADYRAAARAAGHFVESRMQVASASGPVLTRRYRQGDADIDAMAEDYAALTQGVLDLYETTFEPRWLTWAVRLQEQQDRTFWDHAEGGYFATRAEDRDLLARFKDDYDGAEPSANSLSAMNLLRLWQFTDRAEWRTRAETLFKALSLQLTRAATSVPQLAAALDFHLSTPKQIVIAGDPSSDDTREMLRVVHRVFLPTKVVMLADGGAGQRLLASWHPTVAAMKRLGGRATVYVCENYICKRPTADPKTAAAMLTGAQPF